MKRQAASTIHPKTLYYKTDGTGRDLYIACDSGGHFKPDTKLGSRPQSAVGLVRRPVTPISIGTKSVHYAPDGSGRDSYIKVSDGGLHCLTYRGPEVFASNLRSYQRLPSARSSTDLLRWSQTWQSRVARKHAQTQRLCTTLCVSRLTRRLNLATN